MIDFEREDPQGQPRDDATDATVTRLDPHRRPGDHLTHPGGEEPTPWGELDGPFGWDPLDAA